MNYQKGYVTLILVLCVSAVAVLLVTTLFDRSVRASQGVIQQQDNTRARVFTDSCIDYALDVIAANKVVPCPPTNPTCPTVVSAPVFPMSGGYQFKNGECTYEISGSDPVYTISSLGTSGRVTLESMAVTNTTYPIVRLSSYQEI